MCREEWWCEVYAEYNLKTLKQSVTVQQGHFPANKRHKTRLIHLLTQKMAPKGIETTGDSDTYIVRCGLEKAISHSIVAITGQT
ncbi:hypothetical protein AVEN_252825-1 [Araneus ventricosus]|uniref:Uncharacterized protein n=1 Tax=Araneus ventricosus TaxID=182803 RepID=A0A4Y2CL46_ARAVE|nr:hypothetical protein AVEN_252825-1 [Araneus ventricosus]